MSPRVKLLVLLAVLASPVVASYLAYYFWQPGGSVNYGQLMPVQKLPFDNLVSLAEGDAGELKGKWVLLTVGSGECDTACAGKLYLMRQVRTAQGKHMERIARTYLVDDNAAVKRAVMRPYQGTIVLKTSPAVLAALPATDGVRSHIYLVDPLGNLVLRYPADPDARRIIKDLTRLLSVSQIG